MKWKYHDQLLVVVQRKFPLKSNIWETALTWVFGIFWFIRHLDDTLTSLRRNVRNKFVITINGSAWGQFWLRTLYTKRKSKVQPWKLWIKYFYRTGSCYHLSFSLPPSILFAMLYNVHSPVRLSLFCYVLLCYCWVKYTFSKHGFHTFLLVLSVQLVKSIWKEVQCMSFSGGIYSLQNLSVYTMFISHFAMPIFSIFSSFFSVYAFSIYEYEIFPSWIFSNFIFALTTKNQEAWWSPKMEKERLMFIEWGFRRWIQLAAKYQHKIEIEPSSNSGG